MKSLYGQYIEEREGLDIIETEHGFITYSVSEDQCFIHDFFVRAAERDNGLGEALFQKLRSTVRAQGAKWLVCQVAVAAKNSTQSLTIILRRGFKVIRATEGAIILRREL